jgi:hypothetical protein
MTGPAVRWLQSLHVTELRPEVGIGPITIAVQVRTVPLRYPGYGVYAGRAGFEPATYGLTVHRSAS